MSPLMDRRNPLSWNDVTVSPRHRQASKAGGLFSQTRTLAFALHRWDGPRNKGGDTVTSAGGLEIAAEYLAALGRSGVHPTEEKAA